MDALYLSRRQTASVAEATLRFVDDERTAQTREDGAPNESVVPKDSNRKGANHETRYSRLF